MKIVANEICYHCGERFKEGYDFTSYLYGVPKQKLVLSKTCFNKLVRDKTRDKRQWDTTGHGKILLWCDKHGGDLLWESDTVPNGCLHSVPQKCTKYRGIFNL